MKQKLYKPRLGKCSFCMRELWCKAASIGIVEERKNRKDWPQKGRYFVYGTFHRITAYNEDVSVEDFTVAVKEAVDLMNEYPAFSLPMRCKYSTLTKKIKKFKEALEK